MSKTGQKTEEQGTFKAGSYVMLVRCTAPKGCQRDNFLYEFNEKFTTTVEVTDRVFEKKIAPVEEAEQRRLSVVEMCQLALPSYLEIQAKGDSRNLPRSIKEQIENPPKPGQTNAQQKPLSERISDACQTLDHSKDHHWSEDRKPSPPVVGQLLGESVNAAQIEAAAPGMTRRDL